MSDINLFDGWGSGRSQDDWDAMNERLKQPDESHYEYSEPRARRPYIRFSDAAFRIFAEQKREPQKTLPRQKAQRIISRDDIEVTDVSRDVVSFDNPKDTTTERLGLKVGKNYVTIVRYDGADNYVVDVNGKSSGVTQSEIDDFIVANLEW